MTGRCVTLIPQVMAVNLVTFSSWTLAHKPKSGDISIGKGTRY